LGFFEHQSLARRNTRVMVVLFLVAVVVIAAAVDAVFTAAAVLMFELDTKQSLVWGGVAAAAVILVVSLVEMAKLASGGEAVAKMLGARRLAPGTGDLHERRLLNVVEEMAIASGVRVPAVYVLDDERGLNALAAGWDVSNAMITVTRGALETLNRDELQGVIGHEFSHIVNGDVRLNVRMIGVLGGIVFIGSIGLFIMRGSREADDIRAFLAIFTFGLVVFLIGYIGLFFARLIKAAVSRQRSSRATPTASPARSTRCAWCRPAR
jgi:Zn-dependent protease with chaperone function